MIEILIFSIFILSFLFLIFDNINIRIKNKTLKQKNINLIIDSTIFANKLKEEIETKDSKSLDQTEGFLKFVSQSRELAFKYIEEVQAGLNKFINDVEPEIKYFDEYGVVGSAYPHYYSMKKISESYKDLKTLLPEEDLK
jgi:hypothetical protein